MAPKDRVLVVVVEGLKRSGHGEEGKGDGVVNEVVGG